MNKLQGDGEWSEVLSGRGRVRCDSDGSAAGKSQTWPFVAGFNFSWLHTYWAKESAVWVRETEIDCEQQQETCYLHCHWRRNCCRYLDVQSSAKKQHTDSDDRWTGRTQRLHGLCKERERETGKQRGERDRESEPYVELSFSHTDMCAYCKTYKNYKDIRYVQSINKTVLCSPCSSSSGSSSTGKVTHKSWHKPYERNTFDLIQMRLGVGQEAQGGTGEQQQQEETKQALSAAVAGWDLCRATF